MLSAIHERDRLIAPSAEPHAVAVDGDTLYVSSRATQRIDVIDRLTWKKTGEIDPPGMPWGMNFGSGTLVMTCGEPPDDARRIHRYAPGAGFESGAIDCPDDTGSHLAVVDGRIMLGQWYNQRLLVLGDDGVVERSYNVPHGICGVAVHDGTAYCATTDDEDAGDYWLTRVDLASGDAEDVAIIPFHARGLAFDGECFWTNHRAADRIVAFTCT